MYLPEYTILHRASKIYHTLRCSKSDTKIGTYRSIVDGIYDNTKEVQHAKIYNPAVKSLSHSTLLQRVRYQQALQEILEYSIPGCRIHRYVSIQTIPGPQRDSIVPLFSCEIMEPIHTYMVVILTTQGAIIISPFNNLSLQKESGNEYVAELLPWEYIEEFSQYQTPEEKYQALCVDPFITIPATAETPETTFTIAKYIFTTAMIYAFGIQKQDQILEETYGTVSQESILLMNQTNEWFVSAKKQFGFEDIQSAVVQEPIPISHTEFLPLVVKRMDEVEAGTVSIAVCKKEDGSYVRRLTIQPNTMTEDTPSTVCLLHHEAHPDMILECESGYVVGPYLVFIHGTQVESVLLTDVIYEEDTPIIGTESYSFEERISMEASLSSLKKAFIAGAKKAGVHSQELLHKLGAIVKLPFQTAKDLFQSTTRVLKRGIDYEKEESLELREKLLNDELDIASEKFLYWAQTLTLTSTAAFILGNWFFAVIGFFFAKKKVSKGKLKAIERLEMKLDHAIERLDVKIESARGESDYKGVDALMKEKELYEHARFKLKDLKTDLVKKESIKYVTYDSDLGLTPRERLQKAYQEEHPIDLRHNYRN